MIRHRERSAACRGSTLPLPSPARPRRGDRSLATRSKRVRRAEPAPRLARPIGGWAGILVKEAQEGAPMTKIVAAIVTAALLAGAAVMIPGLSPVQAHMMGSKGDRLDLRPYGT